MTRDDLYAFMQAQRFGVVSSIGTDGLPQSAVVGIAVMPGLEIVFDTLSDSRKARNLTLSSACSFVLWEGAVTIQFEGAAQRYLPIDEREHKQTYLQAHPGGYERLNWALLVYFVVTPKWIRYSDYRQHPPIIEEITFSPAENSDAGESERG